MELVLQFNDRDIIRESWKRCVGYGLNSLDQPKLDRVHEDKWQELIENHKDLLEIAKEYKGNFWGRSGKRDYIYGIADGDGILFFAEGDSRELKEHGYDVGYIHLESNMGTNAINLCLDTGKPTIVWGEDHFFKNLRGWVGFAAPVYMDNNQVEAVIFIMLSIKESNVEILNDVIVMALNTEQCLKLMNEKQELMHINRLKQDNNDNIIQTTSIIAHEVRNALTNISAYIQLLQLDQSIDNSRGDRILSEINRVGKLFDDFKLFTGIQELEIRKNFVGDIVDEVLDIMMARVDLKKIKLVFKDYKNEIPVKVDKNAFHNVFINLIENAIEAMEFEGRLTIELGVDEGTNEALISFKNTGKGIPPDQIHQIFNLFHTTKKSGSGIGLYVCQTIVKHHGGRIEVYSDGEIGATFIIRLPISEQ